MAQKLSKVMYLLQELEKWLVVTRFVKIRAYLEPFSYDRDSWTLNYHIDEVKEVIRAYSAYTHQANALEEDWLG